SRLRLRPLWPSGKVSVSEPEGSRLKTRFHRRSPVFVGLRHAQSDMIQRPSVGVVWKLREGECQLRCRPRHLTAVQNY
ncbi:hypothetical protein AVEN_202707-1, partial [Araneus ventricosus]